MNLSDAVEVREMASLKPRAAELIRDHSGLTTYQLSLLIKLTGSNAVIKTYRARLNAIGKFGRDEHGLVQ